MQASECELALLGSIAEGHATLESLDQVLQSLLPGQWCPSIGVIEPQLVRAMNLDYVQIQCAENLLRLTPLGHERLQDLMAESLPPASLNGGGLKVALRLCFLHLVSPARRSYLQRTLRFAIQNRLFVLERHIETIPEQAFCRTHWHEIEIRRMRDLLMLLEAGDSEIYVIAAE